MPDEHGNQTSREIRDAWIRRAMASAQRHQPLECVECGLRDDNRRGWTLRLDVDDELVAFCPECDRREFGDG